MQKYSETVKGHKNWRKESKTYLEISWIHNPLVPSAMWRTSCPIFPSYIFGNQDLLNDTPHSSSSRTNSLLRTLSSLSEELYYDQTTAPFHFTRGKRALSLQFVTSGGRSNGKDMWHSVGTWIGTPPKPGFFQGNMVSASRAIYTYIY
jgi:hypothetical protein